MAALIVSVAALFTQPVLWYDAGLYHFQVVQWLSKYGAVPGLALIHARFGFTSAWFALAAPFNAGSLEAHTHSLIGGFALLLALLHLALCSRRVITHQGRLSDWFIIFASFIYLLPLLRYGVILVSSSPDVPVIILTVVSIWSILLLLEQSSPKQLDDSLAELQYEPSRAYASARSLNLPSLRNFQHSEASRVGEREQIYTPVQQRPDDLLDSTSLFDATLIPLILSVGTMTFKVSAVVLVAVSGWFYLSKRLTIQRMLAFAGISLLLMLPFLTFGVITSGCPLYPSTLLCTNLPWSVDQQQAAEITKIAQEWQRWSGPTPADATNWNWIEHWLGSEKQAAFLLICLLIAALVIAAVTEHHPVAGAAYVITASVLGSGLVMYSLPTLRIGLGYFCLLPAFSLALTAARQRIWAAISVFVIIGSASFWDTPIVTLSLMLLVFALAVLLLSLLKANYPKVMPLALLLLLLAISYCPFQLLWANVQYPIPALLPPAMPVVAEAQLKHRRSHNIRFVEPNPSDFRCWATPLPCTPYPTYRNIRLKDPKRGLGGGFVRSRKSAQKTT
jgi:hypothetical protein